MLARQSGAPGDILEHSIAFVAEQGIVKLRTGLGEFRELRAVGEVEIHPPIVVEVENGDAAAEGLREVFARGGVAVAGDVREGTSGGDIGEEGPLLGQEQK